MPSGYRAGTSSKRYKLTTANRHNPFLEHLESVSVSVEKTGDGRVTNRRDNAPLNGEFVTNHRNTSIHASRNHRKGYYDRVGITLWLPRHFQEILDEAVDRESAQKWVDWARAKLEDWHRLDEIERQQIKDVLADLAHHFRPAVNNYTHAAWFQLDKSQSLRDRLDRYNPSAMLARLLKGNHELEERVQQLIGMIMVANRGRDHWVARQLQLADSRQLGWARWLRDRLDVGLSVEDQHEALSRWGKALVFKPDIWPLNLVLAEAASGQYRQPLPPEVVRQGLLATLFERNYAERQFPFNWLRAHSPELRPTQMQSYIPAARQVYENLLTNGLGAPYDQLVADLSQDAKTVIRGLERGDSALVMAAASSYLDLLRYRAKPGDPWFDHWYHGIGE